jgi:hypothetical protein
VPDGLGTAILEDAQEADQIALGVGVGMRQRMADAGLGRQMNDQLRLGALKYRAGGFGVRQIDFVEGVAFLGLQDPRPGFL